MDESRFRELERKRDAEGLSDDEADELGRMMAEQEGRPYSNADMRPDPDTEPKAWDEAAKEREEEGDAAPVRPPGPSGSDARRAPIGPAPGGTAPAQGSEEPASS